MEDKLDVLYKDIVELLARQDEKIADLMEVTQQTLEKQGEILDELDNIIRNYE